MRWMILLLALVGCAQTDLAGDGLGYTLPEACRGDLSGVEVPILDVSPRALEKIARQRHIPPGQRLWGVTWQRSFIMVDSTAVGWRRAAILQHERCHVIVGDWHG